MTAAVYHIPSPAPTPFVQKATSFLTVFFRPSLSLSYRRPAVFFVHPPRIFPKGMHFLPPAASPISRQKSAPDGRGLGRPFAQPLSPTLPSGAAHPRDEKGELWKQLGALPLSPLHQDCLFKEALPLAPDGGKRGTVEECRPASKPATAKKRPGGKRSGRPLCSRPLPVLLPGTASLPPRVRRGTVETGRGPTHTSAPSEPSVKGRPLPSIPADSQTGQHQKEPPRPKACRHKRQTRRRKP